MTHDTDADQPEALRLDDALRDGQYSLYQERAATEAELRRLHARVQELEASQARVPLSDEQITDIWMQPISNGVTASEWRRSIARAIERAHGIGKDKA